jgi:hypothetical protein
MLAGEGEKEKFTTFTVAVVGCPGATWTEPRMPPVAEPWITQWYPKSPAFANVCEKLPEERTPESNDSVGPGGGGLGVIELGAYGLPPPFFEQAGIAIANDATSTIRARTASREAIGTRTWTRGVERIGAILQWRPQRIEQLAPGRAV